ncbi:MAG: aminopeptidase [Acidobacteria bacterium]|nr:MAG: aminopeptidase [Acidobacteriota bacterium]
MPSMRGGRPAVASILALILATAGQGQEASARRARDLGLPFEFGTPGRLNAVTDVPGVEVGHVTLLEGDAVRTGVTAVLPRGRGKPGLGPCFAGAFSLNGNGEMTGIAWVEESGLLEGPVVITNTNSVGVARDAVIDYARKRLPGAEDWPGATWSLPVVAETWDGYLNDIYGMHVRSEHVFQAIDAARGGPVAEGNVGGGTGMICYEFKGGIGTASRALAAADGGYTLGVLVQANFGRRHQLLVGGLPVGRELTGDLIYTRRGTPDPTEAGSIIIVVATDAPLLPHQLKRLARRAALGVARTGSVSGNGSGDLFLAFSTANPRLGDVKGTIPLSMLPNDRMGPLFEATVGATEEAIMNALVAARTMSGRAGHRVVALPQDRVRDILRRHLRLAPEPAPN